MRSAKWYAFRLSSKRRSTCEDLRRVEARIEAAAASWGLSEGDRFCGAEESRIYGLLAFLR